MFYKGKIKYTTVISFLSSSDFIPSGFPEILSHSLGQVFAAAPITSFTKEEISEFDFLLTYLLLR